jgi:hypothetical protein
MVPRREMAGRFAFMAKDKKSFLLYCDQSEIFNKLPDDKCAQLIRHIFAYVNDENPECEDLLLQIAFEPIKQQLKRDLGKYRNTCERNQVNGAKGGRPKKTQENPNNPVGFSETQLNPTKPKKPDTDTDTDTDTESDNVNEKKKKDGAYTPEFLKFWNIYPRKEAKPDAFKAFKKIKPDELDKILRHVPVFCQGKEPQYIPHPASYLNKRRWEDEQTKTVQPLINRRIITADTEL